MVTYNTLVLQHSPNHVGITQREQSSTTTAEMFVGGQQCRKQHQDAVTNGRYVGIVFQRGYFGALIQDKNYFPFVKSVGNNIFFSMPSSSHTRPLSSRQTRSRFWNELPEPAKIFAGSLFSFPSPFGTKRLVQIFKEIIFIFDPDGETDDPFIDSGQ